MITQAACAMWEAAAAAAYCEMMRLIGIPNHLPARDPKERLSQVSAPATPPAGGGDQRLLALAVRSLGWTFLARAASESARLLRFVVLARLLAPLDFGLMAIGMFALGCIETFTETGFNAALVQKQGDVRPYLDTAFTVQAVRGLLLGALLAAASPWVAAFFHVTGAAPVIAALGAIIFLKGLANPATVLLTRELDFRKVFFWNLSEVLVTLVAAIVLAIQLGSVWALVFSVLAGQAAKTAVSYYVHPYRPRFRFDRGKAGRLAAFGKWVFGTNVLVFFSLQGDNAFVARFLGAAALGYYNMAFRLAELPRTLLTEIVAQPAYALFSRLQADTEALRRAYFRAFRVLFVLALLMGTGIYVSAPLIVLLALGQKWLPIVPALRVLVIAACIRSLVAFGGWLFYSSGRPQLTFALNLSRLVGMLAVIYPLARAYGITGVAWSVLIGICASVPVYFYGVTSSLRMNGWDHFTALFVRGADAQLQASLVEDSASGVQ